ncbi:cyclic peptide export ABC transporter [Shimia thalassica]|uniref:cyclic peptide export ABC transporter n=1 Tax=Shimia thalassica TaxID=1715693 RepID=UPI002494ADD7|nr:cyclic peptide export ABC transporter [Shimia thalassica]
MTQTPPTQTDAENGSSRRLEVLHYLLVTSGVLRDPVIWLTLMASLSRAGMIFAINRAASQVEDGIGAQTILILLVSAGALLIAGFFVRIRAHTLIVRINEQMRTTASQRLLHANIDFLLSRSHGKVYAAMTSEVEKLSGSIINLIQAIEAVIVVGIAIPYLFWISPIAGFATVLAVVFGSIGWVLFDPPARRFLRKASEAYTVYCDRVSDMLSGWKEVRLRASRREAIEQETVNTIHRISADTMRAERRFSASTGIGEVSVILLLCFMVIGLPSLQSGGTATMFQVLTVIFLTSGPIELLFAALPKISQAENAYYRLRQVEADLATSQSPALSQDVEHQQGFKEIELRNVVARVGDKTAAGGEVFELGPINLGFKPGETVFICGGNGSGKTTLLSLITGMRNPDQGEILLDGQPLDDRSKAIYRELFCGVFSEFHLFDRTFGMTSAEEDVLEQRIVDLKLSNRVTLAEGRFSTLSLSAGQKRRLALSVALAENRPVIILDEFAADQDPENRTYFYDVLIPELAATGQLVIAVTHDDHQFGKCDRLIKMENGHIVSDQRMSSDSERVV